MADRVIPISKKQSEMVDEITKQITTLEQQRSLVLTTLISADGQDVPPRVQWRTENKDGVYTLIITTPEPLAKDPRFTKKKR